MKVIALTSLVILTSAFAHQAKAEGPALNSLGKVYFEFSRSEFPSCAVVESRIRNTKVRMSEIENLVKHLARRRDASPDIESLRAVSREYLASILDEEDLEVKLTVEWKSSLAGDQFHFFKLNGPGLSWHSNLPSVPRFLSLQFSGESVRVSYRISTLDFCFGDRSLVLQGRAAANPQSSSLEYDVENAAYDHLLRATWVPDVRRPVQEIKLNAN